MYIDELFTMGDEEDAVIYFGNKSKVIKCKFFDAAESARIQKIEFSSSKPEAHVMTKDLFDWTVPVGDPPALLDPNDYADYNALLTNFAIYHTKITIRNMDYTIKGSKPDGTGLTVLSLSYDS